MDSFAFMTASETLFERGTSGTAAKSTPGIGSTILLLIGTNTSRVDWLAVELQDLGCRVKRVSVGKELDTEMLLPTISSVRGVGGGFTRWRWAGH